MSVGREREIERALLELRNNPERGFLVIPDGLVVWSCTSHPGVLGSIPKQEQPSTQALARRLVPCVQSLVGFKLLGSSSWGQQALSPPHSRGLALLVHPLEWLEDVVHVARVRDDVMLPRRDLLAQALLLQILAPVERLVHEICTRQDCTRHSLCQQCSCHFCVVNVLHARQYLTHSDTDARAKGTQKAAPHCDKALQGCITLRDLCILIRQIFFCAKRTV